MTSIIIYCVCTWTADFTCDLTNAHFWLNFLVTSTRDFLKNPTTFFQLVYIPLWHHIGSLTLGIEVCLAKIMWCCNNTMGIWQGLTTVFYPCTYQSFLGAAKDFSPPAIGAFSVYSWWCHVIKCILNTILLIQADGTWQNR